MKTTSQPENDATRKCAPVVGSHSSWIERRPAWVRNNIAGAAEGLMLLHIWACGMATATGDKWYAAGLLIGGTCWLLIGLRMRERFAVRAHIEANSANDSSSATSGAQETPK